MTKTIMWTLQIF